MRTKATISTKPTTVMSLPNTTTLNEIKEHAKANNQTGSLERSILEIAFGGKENIPVIGENTWNYRYDMMTTRGYYGRYAGIYFTHDQNYDTRPWKRAVKFTESEGGHSATELDLQKVRDKWNELVEFHQEFLAERKARKQEAEKAESNYDVMKEQTLEAFGDTIKHYSGDPAKAFEYSKDARLEGEALKGEVKVNQNNVKLTLTGLTPEQAAWVFDMVDKKKAEGQK